MKRILLAALGALGVASFAGCYAPVAPYSYGPAYGAPAYYGQPVYRPAYVAPVYRPAARVYVAPARPVYRTAVVAGPRYGRYW